MQDDGGGNLIDEGLVLPRLLVEAAVNHGTMGQHGGETLVNILDGHFGLRLLPSGHELLHPRQILARLTIGLHRLAYDDALHGLLGHVIDKKLV